MSEPTDGGAPVLGYAGRLIEGSGPWREQVESLIAIPCAPEALRRYFKNPGDAARYFGAAMARQYRATDPEPCVLCGAAVASRLVRLTWVVRLNWAFLRPVGEAHFPTQHRVCDRCADRGWRRLRMDRWWGGVFGWSAFACAVALWISLYNLAGRFPMNSGAVITVMLLAILLLILIAVSFSVRTRQRWREKFAITMPDGVRFMGVVAFSRRPE